MGESDVGDRNQRIPNMESKLMWNLSFKAEDYVSKGRNYLAKAEEYLSFIKTYELVTSRIKDARATRSIKKREDNMRIAGILYPLMQSVQNRNRDDAYLDGAMSCLKENYGDFFKFMEQGKK